eukprot:CAMPEP_0195602494 /NCGR_PEP_ID=MMETSP0815-20121206/5634_1 /TAXON_ID=97485 /ORGANISM="Prymnesium parvum, Strain Texoma1" /LENGTH=79 /DNA_ID=CAMNT_0040742077 /DNA_START=602 /DNA_END=838 /DNA_ORIENTATION=+
MASALFIFSSIGSPDGHERRKYTRRIRISPYAMRNMSVGFTLEPATSCHVCNGNSTIESCTLSISPLSAANLAMISMSK